MYLNRIPKTSEVNREVLCLATVCTLAGQETACIERIAVPLLQSRHLWCHLKSNYGESRRAPANGGFPNLQAFAEQHS